MPVSTVDHAHERIVYEFSLQQSDSFLIQIFPQILELFHVAEAVNDTTFLSMHVQYARDVLLRWKIGFEHGQVHGEYGGAFDLFRLGMSDTFYTHFDDSPTKQHKCWQKTQYLFVGSWVIKYDTADPLQFTYRHQTA